MDNLARKKDYEEPFMAYGRVTGENGRWFEAVTEFGAVRAVRAAGCLLRPAVGDEVLLSAHVSGRCYVLSVLERAEGKTAELDFDGQVNLNVRGGGLAVHSEMDVSVVSEAGTAVACQDISVHARQGDVVMDRVSFVGRAVDCQVDRIFAAARSVEQTFRTLTQRLKNVFRYVEEHEEVQTNTTRYLVEDLLAMHTKNTDLTSEEVVKVMAEQIHLA